TAADHLTDVTHALIAARVENQRVLGIHREVTDAGDFIDEERPRPRRAAVGRLEDATIAAATLREERALRRDVHNVRVFRIDDDLADVLGLLEADAFPRLTSVRRLVETGAEVRAALAVVLARAEPDGVRVLRIDDDAAEAEG